ncbi:hypothetical protein CF336_g5359 [Tilletia laevis]|nr:hypothetical protein CF336_g5359 [Tilletia laevis]
MTSTEWFGSGIMASLSDDIHRHQAARSTSVVLARPAMDDLAGAGDAHIDLYIAHHNALLIRRGASMFELYRLGNELSQAFNHLLAHDPRSYRIRRALPTNLAGLKFLDQNRSTFCTISTLSSFMARFEDFTAGVLKGLDFRLIHAGGSAVVACLLPTENEYFNYRHADVKYPSYATDAERSEFCDAFVKLRTPYRLPSHIDRIEKRATTPSPTRFTASIDSDQAIARCSSRLRPLSVSPSNPSSGSTMPTR